MEERSQGEPGICGSENAGESDEQIYRGQDDAYSCHKSEMRENNFSSLISFSVDIYLNLVVSKKIICFQNFNKMAKYNLEPVDVPKVNTKYRKIKTKLPVPESLDIFEKII